MSIYRITVTKYGEHIRLIVPGGYYDVTDPEEEATLKREIRWAQSHLPAEELTTYIEWCYNEGSLQDWHDSDSYAQYCACML